MEEAEQEYQGAELITGLCLDGPMDGMEASSRFPSGFLVCDRVAGKAWLYDWDGRKFVCRDSKGMVLLDEDDGGADSRQRAAEGNDYDVIAAPWVVGSEVGDNEELDGEEIEHDNSGS